MRQLVQFGGQRLDLPGEAVDIGPRRQAALAGRPTRLACLDLRRGAARGDQLVEQLPAGILGQLTLPDQRFDAALDLGVHLSVLGGGCRQAPAQLFQRVAAGLDQVSEH